MIIPMSYVLRQSNLEFLGVAKATGRSNETNIQGCPMHTSFS